MENIRVALITQDREYGRALGLAMVDVYRNFTVTLYRSVPVHNELDSMDLVLSDVSEGFEIKGRHILLTDKISQINKNYEDKIFCLYKYWNVRQLAGELLYIYSSLTGRRAAPIRNVNARIYVFASASGGSGCTSAAMAFAREMKRFHEKKVMYLSMEEIESTLAYMTPMQDGKNVSEYLYHLFNNRESEKFPFIESYLISDPFGVEALIPSPGRNVMKSLSPEEMVYFTGAVLDTGGYDILVIDAGNCLEKSILTCYEMANSIFLVSEKKNDNRKEECFMEYILFAKGEKVIDKIRKAEMPYDEESFTVHNELCLIKPEGKFGRKIKEIAGILT